MRKLLFVFTLCLSCSNKTVTLFDVWSGCKKHCLDRNSSAYSCNIISTIKYNETNGARWAECKCFDNTILISSPKIISSKTPR